MEGDVIVGGQVVVVRIDGRDVGSEAHGEVGGGGFERESGDGEGG